MPFRACQHTHAIIGQTAAATPTVLATTFPLTRTPFVYQQEPTKPDGSPLLPHVWFQGSTPIQVEGGRWDAVDALAQRATWLGEWLIQRGLGTYVGPVVLNIESVPLNTPEAVKFWEIMFPAMRKACPRVQWGFYGGCAELDHLTDFQAISIYPIKHVLPAAKCWADGEHEQTPARYRHQALANIRHLPRRKPWITCCTLTIDMQDYGTWCTVDELMEQWKLAQDLETDIIWWGSLRRKNDGDLATNIRRAISLCNWIKNTRASLWNGIIRD